MTASFSEILWVVSTKFSLHQTVLLSRQRRRAVAVPRFIAFHLARENGSSYPKIGTYFCRDHSTVIVGIRRLAVLTARHTEIATWLEECRAALQDVVTGREAADRPHIEAARRGEICWPVEAR